MPKASEKTYRPPEPSRWPGRIFWIAVIAGGAWWAMREGYLPDFAGIGGRATPIVILSDAMTVGSPHVPDATGATMSVRNGGDSAVAGCQVWWYSGSQIGNTLRDNRNPPDSLASRSAPFTLQPGESRVIRMVSLPYRQEGTFPSRFVLHCANPKFASLPVDHAVEVRARQ